MWAEITGDCVNKKQTGRYITQERKKGKGKRCQEISAADTAGEKGILHGHYSEWTANGQYQTILPCVRPIVLTVQ